MDRNRFASLRGSSREWLSADEYDEIEIELDEHANDEPEWDPWWPVTARSRTLAQLGDVMVPDDR